MLLLMPPVRAYADAGTLVISGGTIAVGGAGTIASGAIAGPVVVAVFCGMMAMGMNVSLTNASKEAGMTKTQYIKSKLEQYCNEAQITFGVFNNAILNGTTILANGAIKLGSQAGTQIKQFTNWLFSSNQVIDTSAPAVNSININGYQCPVIKPGDTGNLLNVLGSNCTYSYNEGVAPMALISIHFEGDYAHNTYEVYAISSYDNVIGNTDISTHFTYNGNNYDQVNTAFSTYNNINCTLIYYGYYRDIMSTTIPIYDYGQGDALVRFCNEINGTLELGGISDAGIDTFTGSKSDYDRNSGALSPSNGESTVVNPGLTGSIPIPADTDVTVNVRDYLDALEKVIDGIQTGIVAKDKETDIPITIPIPVDTDLDPTIDKEDDEDLPNEDEQTPVQDPDKPVDPEQDPEGATAPLKFNITNIFPFCIPFDIKDMLSLLNAEPVAPSYHVSWMVPIVNTPLEFTIDLSPWNSVALIARKMELLSFIVGLAVLTRNLIRG